MTENKELSKSELEKLCTRAAIDELNKSRHKKDHKGIETEFMITEEENGLYKAKSIIKKLHIISSAKHMQIYTEAYTSKYRSLSSSKNPNHIFIEDCYIDNAPNNYGAYETVFKNCKISFPDNLNRIQEKISFVACELNCAANTEIQNLVRISSSYVGSNIVLNGKVEKFSHGRTRIPLIVNSTFNSATTCAGQFFIIGSGFKLLAFNRSRVEIIQSTIEELVLSDMRTISMSDIKINNCSIDRSNFSVVLFDNVNFKKTPQIANSSFAGKNVNFSDIEFFDKSSSDALGFFREMKSLCEDSHYEHGTILFHGLELETYYNKYLKRKCPKRSLPEKVSSILHQSISDYGRDLLKPFLALLFLFVAGININFINDMSLVNAFQLSLKDSLGPFFLALPSYIIDISKSSAERSIIIDIFGTVQIMLSSIIWFLIIFMIRRRFKL